jgi:hypothetical protein
MRQRLTTGRAILLVAGLALLVIVVVLLVSLGTDSSSGTS